MFSLTTVYVNNQFCLTFLCLPPECVFKLMVWTKEETSNMPSSIKICTAWLCMRFLAQHSSIPTGNEQPTWRPGYSYPPNHKEWIHQHYAFSQDDRPSLMVFQKYIHVSAGGHFDISAINYEIHVCARLCLHDYMIFPTVSHCWLSNSQIWWPWTRPWFD